LILTFNMGRDITLIILYPFAFGVLAVWCLDHYYGSKVDVAALRPIADTQSRRPSDRSLPSAKRTLPFVRRAAGGFMRRKASRFTSAHPAASLKIRPAVPCSKPPTA